MGDSITWTFSSLEIHTVTFLSGADRIPDLMPLPDGRLAFNPDAAFPSGGTEYDGSGILNSGILSLDPMTGAVPTYTLDFTAAGTFPYVCLIHPLMIARVNVVEADASFSGTQADIDAAAEQEKAAYIQEVEAMGTGGIITTDLGGGNRDYTILAGISSESVDQMYFFPKDFTVYSGDSVTWSFSSTFAPHTVSFIPEGQPTPPLLTPEPQEGGPPLLVLNIAIGAPAGGPEFNPSEYTNSGLLFNPAVGPPGAPGSYTLTFTEPGSYTYVCLLHEAQGMVGRINVLGPPPELPSVGGFTLAPWMIGLAGTLGLALMLGGGLWTRNRLKAEVIS